MNQGKMKMESIKLVLAVKNSGATPVEGMIILAYTLAVMMKECGVPKNDAVTRFNTVVQDIYKDEHHETH